MNHLTPQSNRRSAVALISLLVVAALIMMLAVSTNMLGVNELQLTTSSQFSSEGLSNANACLEETALQLKRNPSYTGATLNLGTITCTITVSANGANRTATIIGTSGSYTKTIEAIFIVTTTGQATNVRLSSWREM